MSVSIYWRPGERGWKSVREGMSSLLDALEQGGCRQHIGMESRQFVAGLVAAKMPGAKELLEALDEHESLDLRESW